MTFKVQTAVSLKTQVFLCCSTLNAVLHHRRLEPSKLTFFKSEGTRKMERLNGEVAGYNEVIYKYLKSIEGKKSTK